MLCPACNEVNPESFGFCAHCHEPLDSTMAGMRVFSLDKTPPPLDDDPPTRILAAPEAAEPPIGESAADEFAGGMIGTRYRIEGALGSGGMGVVYKVRDLKLDTVIALKRLHGDRMGPQEDMRREIALARRVTNENVCRVYDLEEIDGCEYISMEYLEGRTLKELLAEEGKLPLGRTLTLVKQVCRGLVAVEKLGIVHRDLKPENVMVGDGDRVQIMDFGIARLAGPLHSGSVSFGGGFVIGTPQYMSPEQVRGGTIDGRSDIYAVGALLYECVTGRKPYAAETLPEWLFLMLNRDPVSPREIDETLPEKLCDVVLRCLAKDPAARPRSSLALIAEIERLEQELVDTMSEELLFSKTRLVRLMMVLEANSKIHSTVELDPLLRVVLETATQELHAERSTVYVLNEQTGEMRSKFFAGGEHADIMLKRAAGIAGAAAAEGRPIRVEDPYADLRFQREFDKASGFLTKNILAVPIRDRDRNILGVIQVLNKMSGPFDGGDEEFLSTVADSMGAAIRNAWFHERALLHERLSEELRLATAAIARLAPGVLPVSREVEIVYHRVAAGVAGPAVCDDVALTPSGRLTFVGAEAADHRLLAAFSLAALKTAFRLLASLPLPLAERMRLINALLGETTGETAAAGHPQLAAVFLDLDGTTGDFTVLGAGFASLYLGRAGVWRQVAPKAPPLGSTSSAPFLQIDDTLQMGEVLALVHGAPEMLTVAIRQPRDLFAALPAEAGGFALALKKR